MTTPLTRIYRLLLQSRHVESYREPGHPVLAAGGSHSGTVTVTIPAATPPSTYFLLACADGPNTVVETDETNNCKASSTTVTVTP